jgi:RHH-type proline utilization regulon transcriptional repressor/proline dehydrogenase/delta 1-pyrroline-5-carboxylate dehydrogenase
MALSAAMDCGPLDLPGPTGESNQLSLHPLGLIVCLSDDPQWLMDAVVQALRGGNRVLAVGADASRNLIPMRKQGLALETLDGDIDPDMFADLAIAAVAADSTRNLLAIRRSLARRNGPILRLISERFNPAAYVIERALCIDTTAAGGNAALLATSSE